MSLIIALKVFLNSQTCKTLRLLILKSKLELARVVENQNDNVLVIRLMSLIPSASSTSAPSFTLSHSEEIPLQSIQNMSKG